MRSGFFLFAFSFSLLGCVQNSDDVAKYTAKAKRTSARVQLSAAYVALKVDWAELGKYPCEKAHSEDSNGDYKVYNFNDPELKKLCPTCHCNDQSFMILATANLDEDATLDTLTIDHNKNIKVITDDSIK